MQIEFLNCVYGNGLSVYFDVLRIDGNWSEWSNWTECTTSCGVGIQIQYRICNNPPPRNGGIFCKGPSVATRSCGDSSCVPPLQLPIPSSVIPSSGDSHECQCGCHLALENDIDLIITATAEQCNEIASWVIEGPPGTVVSSELSRAALLPGCQWLKIRDGNSSMAPLLLALPSSDAILPELENVPKRIVSTTPLLFVNFMSDLNSSYVASVWGFRMTVRAINPPATKLLLAILGSKGKKDLVAIHIVIIAIGFTILGAIIAYGAYYCRHYPLYKQAILVVDDSPMETPEGSPYHQRRVPVITSTGSASTLTEVLSMKSLKFGIRKGSRSSSYTRLAREGELKNGIMRSLPSSPMLSSKGFTAVRRSSAPFSRLLRRGNSNSYKKQKNRRSASFDQLRMTCISPILEDKPVPNSYTMEDISKKEAKVYIELEPKMKNYEENELSSKGEDHSSKYKEHRKSLLISRQKGDNDRSHFDSSKLSKERQNREKAGLERVQRESNDNRVRESASVSELSVAGTEADLEYDYYDYDVGNASAAPGSLFGMDPTLMPWMIDIDDLDIKSPDQLTSPNRFKVTDEEIRRLSQVTPSPPVLRKKIEEIPLQSLNILSSTDLQQSSTSNESNENNDDDDKTPTVESMSINMFSHSNVSAKEENMTKILNIHDVDDFQYADESEDE